MRWSETRLRNGDCSQLHGQSLSQCFVEHGVARPLVKSARTIVSLSVSLADGRCNVQPRRGRDDDGGDGADSHIVRRRRAPGRRCARRAAVDGRP